MARWKFKPEHYPEPDVEVWDEAWEPVQLYNRYSTQWRVGVGGLIGLDYVFFHQELARRQVDGERFDEFIWCLGVIEAEAMKRMAREK